MRVRCCAAQTCHAFVEAVSSRRRRRETALDNNTRQRSMLTMSVISEVLSDIHGTLDARPQLTTAVVPGLVLLSKVSTCSSALSPALHAQAKQ